MRLLVLVAILLLAFSIAMLHHIALIEFLYWRWLWFDMVMHFLGGMLIGAIAVSVSTFARDSWLSRNPFLVFLFLLVVVSVGWEVLEWNAGIENKNAIILDTAIDLLMNTLGASVIYFTTLWKRK